MILPIFFGCLLSVTVGFSIDSSTPLLDSVIMTEERYDCLVKLFMGERNARLKLKQQVSNDKEHSQGKLQFQQASEKVPSNPLSDTDDRLEKLEEKYNSLLLSQESLYNELLASVNQTKELQEHQKQLLEEKGHEMLLLGEKYEQLKATISDLAIWHNSFGMNTSQILESVMVKQNKLERLFNDTTPPVGFTAIGTSNGKKSAGTVLKFPNIKSSFGITQLSTFKDSGKWSCEQSGIYLLSVTVMTCDNSDTRYLIHKNQAVAGEFYIGRSHGQVEDCNTGAATILLQLYSGDTLHVTLVEETILFENWSIFTIFKIG